MSNPQEVIKFLKINGGTVRLRELRHFPLTILNGLERSQVIIAKRYDSVVYVSINESKIDQRHKEFVSPEQKRTPCKVINIKDFKQEKEEALKPPIPKVEPASKKEKSSYYKKVEIDLRKNPPAPVRKEVFLAVERAEHPLTVKDIQDIFPDMSDCAVQYHLRVLRRQGELFFTSRKVKYWADAAKKHLLEDYANARSREKNGAIAIMPVLKSSETSLTILDIFNEVEAECSTTIIRDTLDYLELNNLLTSSRPCGIRATHFALIENKKAIAHLEQLDADSWDNRIVKMLSERDHYQAEFSLTFGGGLCANNSLVNILRQMERANIIYSYRNERRLYYSLTSEWRLKNRQ